MTKVQAMKLLAILLLPLPLTLGYLAVKVYRSKKQPAPEGDPE